VFAASPFSVGLHLLFHFFGVLFVHVHASGPLDDGREPVPLSLANSWVFLLLLIDLPGFLVPFGLYLPLDVLFDAGLHRHLLILLGLVIEEIADLLKDLEGVLDIYIVGIPHVVPAEGASLSACQFAFGHAAITCDSAAACCYEPVLDLSADAAHLILLLYSLLELLP